MSGDISPPGGSRLETRARPGGERGQGGAVRRPSRGEPSLARVAATTLRLWWRRRVLRVPDGARISGTRRAAFAAILVVVLAAGGVAAVAGSRPSRAPAKPVARPPTPAQLQAAANEQLASSWVAAQVAAGAPLGCDPAMCGHLEAVGEPAADLVTFARAATVPGGAAFVLSTPALRSQSGQALAAGAPEVLASFGTGPQRVDVLVVTTGTASAFLQAARNAQALSAHLGRSLARNRRLHAGRITRRALTSGMVDRRLLVILQQMLVAHAVSVAGFGDADPGASWTAQFRSVTIDSLVHHAGKRRISYVSADLRLVHGLQPPDTATIQEIIRPSGAAALLIQVAVPGSF